MSRQKPKNPQSFASRRAQPPEAMAWRTVSVVLRRLDYTGAPLPGIATALAALPFALEGLHTHLGFEKESTDLVIPLGITLNPHGNIICFSIMAVFIGQLYDTSFSAADLAAMIPIAALAGVAASSAPGIAALSMLALVLEPFGLPALVGIILLTAINPIIDPILTAVNIMGNCACVSIVADNDRKKKAP